MLFLIFGSSAAGKTVALDGLRDRMPELAIHDFDEIGVPAGADTVWRHGANEKWVRRALGYEAEGIDVVLAGQTPIGELLATPSAPLLQGIAACLLDCDDDTRVARLTARGANWFERAGGQLQAYLNWAAWMRRHAQDPTWRQDVIRRDESESDMRWERWVNWQAGDPRWRVRLIDTSRTPVSEVVEKLVKWITDERQGLIA